MSLRFSSKARFPKRSKKLRAQPRLGSQPTAAAVRSYAAESLKLPEPSSGQRFVFLACGRPSSPIYKKLYEALQKEMNGPFCREIIFCRVSPTMIQTDETPDVRGMSSLFSFFVYSGEFVHVEA